MNLSISSLSVSHKENASSIYRFHSSGLVLLWLKISVSTAHMKILAKAISSVKLDGMFCKYERKHFS